MLIWIIESEGRHRGFSTWDFYAAAPNEDKCKELVLKAITNNHTVKICQYDVLKSTWVGRSIDGRSYLGLPPIF